MNTVYEIKNTITGCRYIGCTCNLVERISAHMTGLNKNKHCNKILQADYNYYGIGVFSIKPIYEEENRIWAELFELKELRKPNTYNIQGKKSKLKFLA